MHQLFSVLLGLHRGRPEHGNWVITCLKGAWEKILGERLAAVCRPVRVNNSELVVEILDREWEKALESIRPDLVQKLRIATGDEIKTLSFSLQSAVRSRQ